MRTYLYALGLALSLNPAMLLAAQPERILILEIESDFLSESERSFWSDRLREEVQRSLPSTQVLPRPKLDLESMRLAAGCRMVDASCLIQIGQSLMAERVIRCQFLGLPAQLELNYLSVNIRERKGQSYRGTVSNFGRDKEVEFRSHVQRALGLKPSHPPMLGSATGVPPLEPTPDVPKLSPSTRTSADTSNRLTYTWIFAAGSVVAAATGTYFWLQLKDAEDELPCVRGSVDDPCARGERAATATQIAFPVAIGLGIATVVAYIVEKDIFSSTDAPQAWLPTLNENGTGVAWTW